eukprot:TRINITY_DN3763_c0_g3_i2.p1 TRINITY_DN3763_c0_g3~~TRINITY_DN3763_c0_g3_i2.p1  ORF type:complete len:474 (+),score=131.36 TRINITY_DN3763_c0_g3_i2:65-1486(+)
METKESFMETKGFNETSPEAIKEEIRMIYRKFNPKKLESLPQIFKKYEGREEVLLQDVRSKYTAFNDPDGDLYDKIVEGLKSIYFKKIKPLEEMYQFDEFHSPFLENADFEANPTVLLLGQYSTGKTSFIKWMVNREFPGQRVGPEPTTDRFSAVMHGAEDRIIPGNAAVMASDKPFRPLKIFGTTFMNKFEVSTMNVPALERLTFIDTPGVLSGEKQRIGRSYDFTTVVKWFAEKADRILLLFDAHKLDISDEFKRTIEVLKRHDDKVRVILNKSDSIDEQQLIRVYGAMMWSLGKVYQTPEVLRVYVGSFWDKPYREGSNTSLFTAEKNDLLADLNSLPRNSSIRKINELVKRIRMLIVHVHIIDHMRDNMPSMFGKSKAQKKLIDNLGDEFHKIHKITKLPVGDFPAVREYQSKLATLDFGKLPKRKAKLFHTVERTLEEDIPALMKELPKNGELTFKREYSFIMSYVLI